MVENTMKLCRLCMYEEKCNDDPNQVFSIFSQELKGIDEKIRRCIRLVLKPEDIIPPNVCKNCLECLKQYYNFFDNCHKTDETLRSIFNVPSSYSDTLQNVVSQLSTNHLSNEGTTYVPLTEYDLIYKNQTYITNIDYFSESSSTFPIKNKNDINIRSSTSLPKKFFDDFRNENDTDSTSSLNTISKKGTDINENGKNEHFILACPKCSKVFSGKKKLLQHNVKHKVPGNPCNVKLLTRNSPECCLGKLSDKFKCLACGVGHTSKASLERHLKTCHATKTKGFACHICGKKTTFTSTRSKRRMKYHNTLKPQRCRYCNFTSNSINVLNAHTSRKHCVCQVCARWFKSELSLKQHKRRMHNSRKYICNICSNTFTHRDNLKTHIMKKHAKNRTYDCLICGKGFCKVQQLEEHLVMHKAGCPQLTPRDGELFQTLTAVKQSRTVPWDVRSTRSLPNYSL